MNNERHPENYAVFYGLLNRLPSSDKEALKESIVLQYTDNRTCSLREMTLKEYNAACAGMQKLVPPTFQEQLLKVRKKKTFRSIAPDATVRDKYSGLELRQCFLQG